MSILDGYIGASLFRGSRHDHQLKDSLNTFLRSEVIKKHYPLLEIIIEILYGESKAARRVNDAYDDLDAVIVSELSPDELNARYAEIASLISNIYGIPNEVAYKVTIIAFPHDIDMINVVSARLA